MQLQLISSHPNSGRFTLREPKSDMISDACYLNVQLAHLQKANNLSFFYNLSVYRSLRLAFPAVTVITAFVCLQTVHNSLLWFFLHPWCGGKYFRRFKDFYSLPQSIIIVWQSSTHLMSACLILSWFREAIPTNQGSWLLLQSSHFFLLRESLLKLSRGGMYLFL